LLASAKRARIGRNIKRGDEIEKFERASGVVSTQKPAVAFQKGKRGGHSPSSHTMLAKGGQSACSTVLGISARRSAARVSRSVTRRLRLSWPGLIPAPRTLRRKSAQRSDSNLDGEAASRSLRPINHPVPRAEYSQQIEPGVLHASSPTGGKATGERHNIRGRFAAGFNVPETHARVGGMRTFSWPWTMERTLTCCPRK
jgi:hypothetical protein